MDQVRRLGYREFIIWGVMPKPAARLSDQVVRVNNSLARTPKRALKVILKAIKSPIHERPEKDLDQLIAKRTEIQIGRSRETKARWATPGWNEKRVDSEEWEELPLNEAELDLTLETSDE